MWLTATGGGIALKVNERSVGSIADGGGAFMPVLVFLFSLKDLSEYLLCPSSYGLLSSSFALAILSSFCTKLSAASFSSLPYVLLFSFC